MLLAGKVGYVLKCRCYCELARGVISGPRGGGGHADAENEIGGGVGVLVTRFRGRTAVEHMPSSSAFSVVSHGRHDLDLCGGPVAHTDSMAAGRVESALEGVGRGRGSR